MPATVEGPTAELATFLARNQESSCHDCTGPPPLASPVLTLITAADSRVRGCPGSRGTWGGGPPPDACLAV